ncbi:hypothetical protein B0T22DRAFT_436409 [Podospora appendiculata]|uniref:Uncharacterized protein n=1 Tax=Podospora appendiculata TaxID=314037 RepID=A0AAE0XGU8_9PEZI|nr:hypothetical protein B0T22DRAFT_436409 [Podospora appendiculata]
MASGACEPVDVVNFFNHSLPVEILDTALLGSCGRKVDVEVRMITETADLPEPAYNVLYCFDCVRAGGYFTKEALEDLQRQLQLRTFSPARPSCPSLTVDPPRNIRVADVPPEVMYCVDCLLDLELISVEQYESVLDHFDGLLAGWVAYLNWGRDHRKKYRFVCTQERVTAQNGYIGRSPADGKLTLYGDKSDVEDLPPPSG